MPVLTEEMIADLPETVREINDAAQTVEGKEMSLEEAVQWLDSF